MQRASGSKLSQGATPIDFIPPFRIDSADALRSLVTVSSPFLGEGFLKVLVRTLGELLGADLVFVARPLDRPPTRLQVLAAWGSRAPAEEWDYDIAGQPCAEVYEGETVLSRRGPAATFASAAEGPPMESYIGVPLFDTDGSVAGHLGICAARPRETGEDLKALLRVFGNRAEAELMRREADRERAMLVDELMRLNKRLYEESVLDALTHLPNRRYFEHRCEQESARCHRYAGTYGIMVADLDGFEHVNEAHGHLAGDALLQAVSGVLHHHSRRGVDLVARTAGDEFSLLCVGTDSQILDYMAERIRAAIAALQVSTLGGMVSVTCTIGASMNRPDDPNWEEVRARAYAALTQAKRGYRNRVMVG